MVAEQGLHDGRRVNCILERKHIPPQILEGAMELAKIARIRMIAKKKS